MKPNTADITPFDPDPRRIRERVPLEEAFEQYKACQDDLTRKQWQVVQLYYSEGLSQTEISSCLRKSRSTISDLLRRARERKEAHLRRLRTEAYEVRRKLLAE